MASTVIVVGASGLIGTACVDAFLQAGWDVVAVSRREPTLAECRGYRHLAVDLTDPRACAAAFGVVRQATHLIYAAVAELPGLVAGWSDRGQMAANLAMLRNAVEPLSRANLEHITLLQGTKAYGAHLHPIPVPARERHPRDEHENFYFLQEDYLREKADAAGLGFTILRPQLVLGPNYGVAMNVIPVIGAFAAVCRETGRPFGFPGGAPYVHQAVDVRVVAAAALWAATAKTAWRETFNVTNGEVYAWRELWPSIADALGMEAACDHPVRLAEFLPEQTAVWYRIASEHGLVEPTLSRLLGESHHFADAAFAYGEKVSRPPRLVSTVKIRQAGFDAVCDTEDSVKHWLGRLVRERVLPQKLSTG